MTKFYRAEIPDIFGYSCIGYGSTAKEAVKQCKKVWLDMAKSYMTSIGRLEYPTFAKAWEAFGGSCVEQISGTNAIRGNENYLPYKIIRGQIVFKT